MERVGFVGLGEMGQWMALNILKAGFDLTVYDIRPSLIQSLVKLGAIPTTSPEDLARQVDWIFLSLPDTDIVEKVLFSDDGIVKGARSNQIVVDCSTISYRATLNFAQRLASQGIHFADSPVSGMEARAKAGTLTVMFGGSESIFHQVHPALRAIGDKVIYIGETGSGQLIKLVNQLLFNINVPAIAEVLPMAVKLGLDPEKVIQVVSAGTGQSFALEFFGPLALEGRFDQGYALKRAYKDMISAAEICAYEGIPLPLVQTATTTYQMALAEGYGDENKGAMIKVFEQLLDVRFRRREIS
jgi:3-hydroxyisobutyrate dehydrogenase-like beta-hydroxyacid dehydrogenase